MLYYRGSNSYKTFMWIYNKGGLIIGRLKIIGISEKIRFIR